MEELPRLDRQGPAETLLPRPQNTGLSSVTLSTVWGAGGKGLSPATVPMPRMHKLRVRRECFLLKVPQLVRAELPSASAPSREGVCYGLNCVSPTFMC